MNSDNPHPLPYAHKTKRRAGARYRVALATPKDRQCALRPKNRFLSSGKLLAKVARSRQKSAVRLPFTTNPLSSSSGVLYYSHNGAKQPAPYFNPAYVRLLELAATTDATS
ncbi:hypothetical protein [Ensifer sp. SL37]|uniref:hypothetical protein n=1 Tax=Ensifer sp. SL37 TaxID=2995137 RepID=UPI0022726C66|nr:hypothetical protein [Ensifer sp. SL37]MCY1740585.1 hypothetical protein [Ensifer sp. SL37]